VVFTGFFFWFSLWGFETISVFVFFFRDRFRLSVFGTFSEKEFLIRKCFRGRSFDFQHTGYEQKRIYRKKVKEKMME